MGTKSAGEWIRQKIQKMISDLFISKLCFRLTDDKLDRTVILIDELYIAPQFKKTLQNRKKLDMLLKCKACWIAIVEAGQRTMEPIGKLIPEEFEQCELKVTFRSAHHISEISQRFIDLFATNQNASQPRVLGCFQSSQTNPNVVTFDTLDQVCNGNCNLNVLELSEQSGARSKSKARLTILFTDQNERLSPDLLAKLSAKLKITNEELIVSYVGLWDKDQFAFTGDEAQEVLIIIDLNNLLERSLYIINLAVSRAQYKVSFLIRKDIIKNKKSRSLWREYLLDEKPKRLQDYYDLIEGDEDYEKQPKLKLARLRPIEIEQLRKKLKTTNTIASMSNTQSLKVSFQRAFVFDNVEDVINQLFERLNSECRVTTEAKSRGELPRNFKLIYS